MLNTRKLSATQLDLVKEIVKWGRGRMIFSRKELREAHGDLRGRRASPYFISKNLVARMRGKGVARGSYNLEPFIKFAKAHPPAKKELKPKREVATARKGAKSTNKTMTAGKAA